MNWIIFAPKILFIFTLAEELSRPSRPSWLFALFECDSPRWPPWPPWQPQPPVWPFLQTISCQPEVVPKRPSISFEVTFISTQDGKVRSNAARGWKGGWGTQETGEWDGQKPWGKEVWCWYICCPLRVAVATQKHNVVISLLKEMICVVRTAYFKSDLFLCN